MKCGKLIKPGRWQTPARKCSQPRTHRIVAHGPGGERIDHGEFCRKHADAMLTRFAPKNGWQVVTEPLS